MNSFRDVIRSLGGAAEMAALLGDSTVTANRVRQWSNRDTIPSEYWSALVEKADAAKVDGITLVALAKFAASRKSSSSPAERPAHGGAPNATPTASKAA
jgi:hypothetical protein